MSGRASIPVRVKYDDPKDARAARLLEEVLGEMLSDVVLVGPHEKPEPVVVHIDSLRKKPRRLP